MKSYFVSKNNVWFYSHCHFIPWTIFLLASHPVHVSSKSPPLMHLYIPLNINKRQLKRKIKRNEILFEFSFSVLNYFCLLNPFCIWFQVSLGIKKNSVKTTKHAKLLLNENKYLFLMLNIYSLTPD